MAVPVSVAARIPASIKLRGSRVLKQPELTSLPAYLDTLLPAGQSPSASALDIHYYLAHHALGIPNYVELLKIGCRWLDGSVRGESRFYQLADVQRVQLVQHLDQSPPGTNQKLFFQRTLSDAMGFYYAHPASWQSLKFDGPPQPRGFPDAALPPR